MTEETCPVCKEPTFQGRCRSGVCVAVSKHRQRAAAPQPIYQLKIGDNWRDVSEKTYCDVLTEFGPDGVRVVYQGVAPAQRVAAQQILAKIGPLGTAKSILENAVPIKALLRDVAGVNHG